MLEQLSELEVLLQAAEEMGSQPTAGVRIKLATEGSGRWAKSGGEKSKFGLGAVELMKLLDQLERLDRRTCSSWSTSIWAARSPTSGYVKSGLEEIGRYYVELREHGLRHLPCGCGRRTGGRLRWVAAPPGRPA